MAKGESRAVPEMRMQIKRLERQLKERASKADRLAAKLSQYNARDEADQRMRLAYAVAREVHLPEPQTRFLVALAREQEADFAGLSRYLVFAAGINAAKKDLRVSHKTDEEQASIWLESYEKAKSEGWGHEWAPGMVEDWRTKSAEAEAAAELAKVVEGQ